MLRMLNRFWISSSYSCCSSPFFPLLLGVDWLVCALGRPALFRHVPCGKNGKSFRLHKFRSMTDYGDEDGELAHQSGVACQWQVCADAEAGQFPAVGDRATL